MQRSISSDRARTNILKRAEYNLIQYLCERMPPWITSNGLTAIGLAGGGVVFLGLWLGKVHVLLLLISILGLVINWFGDSLDGRLAYYRNIPRKWYGFSLDVVADWTSTFAIALGFYFHFPRYKVIPFVFVAAYGAAIIIALLRYKITDDYRIDTFRLGPTEMRILVAVMLLLEIFRPNTLFQFGIAGAGILIVMDFVELKKLLRLADKRDVHEKAGRHKKNRGIGTLQGDFVKRPIISHQNR